MDAAVRVKNQWWFEDVADHADAGQRGLEKLLDVIRADAIEFDVLLDPAPDQPERVNTYVAFDDAAWSGAQRGDMRPMAGADFNPINAFGQVGFELRAFPRHDGKITTLAVLSRADLERLAFAAFQALGLEAVTFGPMPDGKPLGGFLEVGDCTPGEDTYPWEADVNFVLGSNGVVYAEVERSVDALPTLDDDGHAIKDEEPAPDDRCPRCGTVDRGEADFIKDHGRCRACHVQWQTGELSDQLESGVHCPKCQSRNVSVVQVACMAHRRPHKGRWPLDGSGFYWADGQREHREGSTQDEVVECDACRERGDLSYFNFQVATP